MTRYATSYAAFCPIHWPQLEDCDASCAAIVRAAWAAHRALQKYWYDVATAGSCVDCGESILGRSQRCVPCSQEHLWGRCTGPKLLRRAGGERRAA